MRSVNGRIAIILFLLGLTGYSYFVQLTGWNQTSRMALVMSVVREGRLSIDSYESRTGDKALYEGHYYSDKAIGTALFGAPVYALARELQDFDRFPKVDDDMRYPIYLVSLAVVALPAAALLPLLFHSLLLMGAGRAWGLLLTLFYGFGSLAFPFATMLFGHQVAAAFAFAAFYALLRARLDQQAGGRGPWWLLAAGTLGGVAVLMEYQVGLIVALLGLYALSFARPLWRVGLYALGGAPWAALLFGYNWLTLGSPLRFAYQYVSNPDFAGMKQGLFGITVPQWSSFVTITVSQQGLLTQSLFLWLVPLGAWQMWRSGGWRRELLLALATGLIFLLWNAAYYLPLGGGTPGPRFLIPSLPFLMLPLAFIPRLPRPARLAAEPLLLLSGLASLAIYALICVTDPVVPFGVSQVYAEHWLPRLRGQELQLNLGTVRFGLYGLLSLLPLGLFLMVAADALVHTLRDRGQQGRLTRVGTLAALAALYLFVALPVSPLAPLAIPFEFLRP